MKIFQLLEDLVGKNQFAKTMNCSAFYCRELYSKQELVLLMKTGDSRKHKTLRKMPLNRAVFPMFWKTDHY
jgi:hypothetical protein